MNNQRSRRVATTWALIIAAILMLGNPSLAEVFPFRVAFENVPGVEKIDASNLEAGIKALEDQLQQVDAASSGDILATLCAAYIINGSLHKAESACNKAVETNPSETAYNNRGVYRAFKGDLTGAREDFERVQPRDIEAYLDELKTKDVGLMSIDNFRLIEELSAKHAPAEINASLAMTTANVENIVD